MTDQDRRLFCAAMLSLSALGAPAARAQSAFPNKPMKFVVPYPPGDGTDVMTRLIAEEMGKDLGVTMLVENRTGAAGLLGAQSVAAAPADGYSLCLLSSGHITHQTLYKRFNLLESFAPVSNVATAPFAFIVPPDSPYRTLTELIEAIKANPGKVSMGTGGHGSPAHMAFEVLRSTLGGKLEINHVPYKSGLESAQAVVGKQTDFASSYIGSVLPLAQGNRVRVLAMTSRERLRLLPDAPTVAEVAIPGWSYETLLYYGVPRKTPPQIISTLFAAITKAAQAERVRSTLTSLGHQVSLSKSPADFETQLKNAIDAELKLIQERQIKVEA